MEPAHATRQAKALLHASIQNAKVHGKLLLLLSDEWPALVSEIAQHFPSLFGHIFEFFRSKKWKEFSIAVHSFP